ncbi:circadian clock protein KaiC [Chromohalobacter marismortui]|uniref:non-specific serine/threonine protein kinase n=1 Tax=Chromohalobacter marismortui TaxID=42055 RepID=A0A4R7NIJ7_9GAMM|nr:MULTISPECIES: ATPase domain-containing protein [Chromohalobacter]MCI0510830.1 AAA family ATPase [Chromohalobacter sp.]MCI0592704.1 AAA family ATPase [Chromohalobacter sp.]TDU20238.1 circadian clock protein KaiC [Chromohalobacter marismortui]
MNEPHGERIHVAIPGLEQVLNGGFLPGRSYLVSGGPGTGKTTLGLQYLASSSDGNGLLISLGESERNLRADAHRIGLSLDGISVIDLSPGSGAQSEATYTLLEPWEAEGVDIRSQVEALFPDGPPKRVFIDALSQLRQLMPDAYQFRKQVMGLLEYLNGAGATVVYTAEHGSSADEDLRYLGDGILELAYREDRRVLRILKFRGSGFAEGEHTLRLGDRGMQVFERLMPGEHRRAYEAEELPCGIEELDRLSGGGVTRGTVTIISGPTGVGKTSLGLQYMHEAARRGERSVVYTFEENLGTLRKRCETIGIPVSDMLAKGSLSIDEVEPLHYSPDEFAWRVRTEVEQEGARMIMLDSLAGFRQSVRDADIKAHTHALCHYLSNMGVTVLLINEQSAIAGEELRPSEDDINYLADTIILLRYMELDGGLRKAIGILKKRTGDFEKTLREFQITSDGLRVGAPLYGLRGILQGIPSKTAPLDATE